MALLTLPLVYQWHARDLQIYYESGLKLLQGSFPYRDFPLEYPPLALLPFALPWLLALGRALGPQSYQWLFMIQNALYSTLIALSLARVTALGRMEQEAPAALAVYASLVIVSAPLLPWRYDLFPALLTMLALLSALAGRPVLAGVWIGLGGAAKLYPIVLLPIFCAYYFAGKARGALARLVLGCAAAIAAIALPFLLIDPPGLLAFLSYHELRGIQLESLPSGVILLAQALGLARVELVFNYGALHLVSPLADAALRWQPLVLILVFGVVYASGLGRFRHEFATSGAVADASLAAYATMALLAFIVTNKVFSAQYIIWLLPFAPLLRPRQAGLAAAVFVLTLIIFPFDYTDLLAMRVVPVLLLNLRNVLAVALLSWLLVEHLPAPVGCWWAGAIAIRRGRRSQS